MRCYRFLALSTSATILVASSVSIAFAWAGPTAAPPGGNSAAPINTSATSQVKAGGFWAASIGSDTGYCIASSCITQWPWTPNGTSIYYSGNIGIGSTTPGTLLSVQGIANFNTATSTFYSSGGINLRSGCFAINGTCIGANQWWQTSNGNDIFYNGGNIGIGNSNPAFKLDLNGDIHATGAAKLDGAVTASNLTSMLPGWPDALSCTYNGVYHYLFYLRYSPYYNGLYYYYSNSEYLIYNPDGTYNSGWLVTDCNVPITQLYAVGRAYNLNNTAPYTPPTSACGNLADYKLAGTSVFTVPSSYNTLTVQVWGGGGGGSTGFFYAGGSGGQSSFNGTVVAGGGGGGGASGLTPGAGGSASGGSTNTQGNPGSASTGGSAPAGGGAGGAPGAHNGANPGGGGGGYAGYGGGGGSGGYSTITYTPAQLAPGSNISIVVGSGGAAGYAGYAGNGGAGEVCISKS